jgi:hypothetical protein
VFDVSNPANCVLAASHGGGYAQGVAIAGNRIYAAVAEKGLLVVATLPNVQYAVRVTATPGVPFTLEAATSPVASAGWAPLLTTNVAVMPFDFVDYDVKTAAKPLKFYRVHQP